MIRTRTSARATPSAASRTRGCECRAALARRAATAGRELDFRVEGGDRGEGQGAAVLPGPGPHQAREEPGGDAQQARQADARGGPHHQLRMLLNEPQGAVGAAWGAPNAGPSPSQSARSHCRAALAALALKLARCPCPPPQPTFPAAWSAPARALCACRGAGVRAAAAQPPLPCAVPVFSSAPLSLPAPRPPARWLCARRAVLAYVPAPLPPLPYTYSVAVLALRAPYPPGASTAVRTSPPLSPLAHRPSWRCRACLVPPPRSPRPGRSCAPSLRARVPAEHNYPTPGNIYELARQPAHSTYRT